MEGYRFKDINKSTIFQLMQESYEELRERMIFMLAERFKDKAREAFDFVSWDGEDEARMDYEMKRLYGVALTKEDKRILTIIKKSDDYHHKAKKTLIKALFAHDETEGKKNATTGGISNGV